MAGSVRFSTLDLFSGYCQIKLEEYFNAKTTFICRFGTYQFKLMPFGLMNSPSIFQRLMDKVFAHLYFVRCYLDDVVVFSNTLDDHLTHLKMVFYLLFLHFLKLKLQNVIFPRCEVDLLGHIIDRNGVRVE